MLALREVNETKLAEVSIHNKDFVFLLRNLFIVALNKFCTKVHITLASKLLLVKQINLHFFYRKLEQ